MKDKVCKFLVNASGKYVCTNLAYTLHSIFFFLIETLIFGIIVPELLMLFNCVLVT
jgi:hypothetical protein